VRYSSPVSEIPGILSTSIPPIRLTDLLFTLYGANLPPTCGPPSVQVHSFITSSLIRAWLACGLLAVSTSTGWAQRIRLMAANLTSGTNQAYEAPGIRIFQGVKPDIVMIQEFNVGTSNTAALRTFVDTAFGTSFVYFREAGGGIPNGVISRYPILEAGEWDDPRLTDRDFVWAKIDVPGANNLWAISVHLKANSTSATDRETQALNLKNFIVAKGIPSADFVTIGGDFNSYSHTEALFDNLSSVVNVSAPYPVDAAGDADTNAGRSSPYDGVYVDSDLKSIQVPVSLGQNSFPSGLVVDTRVYSPLADLAPALAGDSGTAGMQHMGVVLDFMIPLPADPPILTLLDVKFHLEPPSSLDIKFAATAGATYRVQTTSNLTAANWVALGQFSATSASPTISIVTTTPASPNQVQDPTLGTMPRKFYRVIRL
jgi:endonuclease/exonuclease/phosphatase family metal-dependent hydrolase